MKLHPSYIADLQSLAPLDNLWMKSSVPMFIDTACTLPVDNPCSLEVITLADIRFKDPPTLTISDKNGNEVYVSQPVLVDDSFASSTPVTPATNWNEIVGKPSTFAPSAHNQDWSTITTGKPTTLAGYGITDAFTQALADARYPQLSVQYTNPTWLAGIDATTIKTGTIDPARLPVMPTQAPIVSTGDLTALTTEQQNQIVSGTIVTTTDGNRYVYNTGTKTLVSSYIQLADVTPDWSVIGNRPTNVSEWANDAGYLTQYIADFLYQPKGNYVTQYADYAMVRGTNTTSDHSVLGLYPGSASQSGMTGAWMRLEGPYGFGYVCMGVGDPGQPTNTGRAKEVWRANQSDMTVHTNLIVEGGLTVGGTSVATTANLANYAPLVHTHAWSDIVSGKPTTLAGYGITDAASSSHTHTFASLTSKPTTLSGYGITDAASSTHTHDQYLTTATASSTYLPLAGGTLVGAITSAYSATFGGLTVGGSIVSGGLNAQTGAITTSSSVTAGSFIMSGGTATGFLMSNGTKLEKNVLNNFADGAWAGPSTAYGWAASTGANTRFGFSNSGSYTVDVYADGNFYATDSMYRVWHAGDFTATNISNWNGYATRISNLETTASNLSVNYQPKENQRLSTTNGPSFAAMVLPNADANTANALYLGSAWMQGLTGTTNAKAMVIRADEIRFAHTGSAWDWNAWAGIKYDGADIYIGGNKWGTFNSNANPTLINSFNVVGTTTATVDSYAAYNAVTGKAGLLIGNYNYWGGTNASALGIAVPSGYTPVAFEIDKAGVAQLSITSDGHILSRRSMYGKPRPDGDYGVTVYGNSTGARGNGIYNGSSTVAIHRWDYAGFTGYIGDASSFFGITQDHGMGSSGQLSIIAGGGGGASGSGLSGVNIGFYAGAPGTIAAGNGSSTGCQLVPMVGCWNPSALWINTKLRVNNTNNDAITARIGGDLALDGRLWAVDCSISGGIVNSTVIGQWNTAWSRIASGRLCEDTYTGEDSLNWISRMNRGTHWGRIHGVQSAPSYFNYMLMRETTGTKYAVIGNSSDGNWYVGSAASDANLTTYNKIWTTADFSATAVSRINNSDSNYGFSRLYRSDDQSKYYLKHRWTTGGWNGNSWRLECANDHSNSQSGIYTVVTNYADVGNTAYTLTSKGGTNNGANIDTGFMGNYCGLWAGSVDAPTGTTPFGATLTWLQEWGHADGNWRAQLATPYFSDNLAYRRKNNGTWMPWRYVVSSDVSGNVSIGGTLTVDQLQLGSISFASGTAYAYVGKVVRLTGAVGGVYILGGVYGVGYVCNMHTAAINLNYGGGVNMHRWSDGTVQSTISLPSARTAMVVWSNNDVWVMI